MNMEQMILECPLIIKAKLVNALAAGQNRFCRGMVKNPKAAMAATFGWFFQDIRFGWIGWIFNWGP